MDTFLSSSTWWHSNKISTFISHSKHSSIFLLPWKEGRFTLGSTK